MEPDTVLKTAKGGHPFVLILDRLRSAHNVGNVFRLAEAVNAEIIAVGYTPAPPHPALAKTAMGTDRTVRCRVAPDAATAIALARSEGYRQILAVEALPGAAPAWKFDHYETPLALILGNEALGVSAEALQLADGAVALPMLGKKASINVGNAAAAVLYAILAKLGIA